MPEIRWMTVIRWMMVGGLAVNAALAVGNAVLLHHNLEVMRMNDEIASGYRQLAGELPEHSCGSVILPGERCTATFRLYLPDTSL